MITLHINRTIDAYNKNADKYADIFDNYEIYQNKISDFQKKYISNDVNILDLGCGPGNNISTIMKKDDTCCFTGIDLSAKFISIARKRFPQFTFLQQDLRSLDLASEFEIVISSFCIVHLTDSETRGFIKKVSSLIADSGYLYLSYMSGKESGFESTSFSEEEIFFNYYQDQFIVNLLKHHCINILEISNEAYVEKDGSVTTDAFIYAKKENPILGR